MNFDLFHFGQGVDVFSVKDWTGDSDSMYADKSDVTPLMCYDAVWDDEVACDQAYHSLCEKNCSDQVEEVSRKINLIARVGEDTF